MSEILYCTVVILNGIVGCINIYAKNYKTASFALVANTFALCVAVLSN